MNIYEKLNVDKYINAAGHFTIVGGSKMSEQTLNDLTEAAQSTIDIRSLQHAVHQEVAKLTNNESAYICNGAATGLYLTIAACIQLKEGKPIKFMDFNEIYNKEVISYKGHRNPYDWSVRQLGVQIKDIGYANNIEEVDPRELEYAINDNTVAIMYSAGNEDGWITPGALSFEEVVKIANKNNIPVIVDAAAQLPPKENLWKLTENGASAVVFSGGKDLGGPQASGLVVGEKELLKHLTEIGFPNYGIGRMMKTGREEIVGLYSAIKQYVEHDEEHRLAWCEEQVQLLIDALKDSPLFEVERTFPNVAGQPLPRAYVTIKDHSVLSIDKLQELLREDKPRVYALGDKSGVYLNTLSLKGNDMESIIEKFKLINSKFA